MKAPDMFGSLIAIGITSLIGLQAIINIAVVTGSIPVTGMPLPFFSYRWNSFNNIAVRCRCIIEYISKCIQGVREKKRKEKNMRAIIAAAGTGGHINPGIAIANKIKQEEPDSKIIFIGTTRGIENDLVPRAGYELKTVEAYGLSKKISLTGIQNNIKTIKSIKKARKIIQEFKPDIVIGTGGYICGPVIMAAKKEKIPTVLHESNAFPGLAVKMLSTRVDKILVGFEEAKESLKKAKKVIVTGTPTKINKLNLNQEQKQKIKMNLKLNPEMPVVLVFGGSQGAKRINDVLLKIIENKLNKNYQIMWAPGPKNYDEVKNSLEEKNISINNIENVEIVPYIYNMEEVMNIADLLVCRSGAITITEISKLGKPAIFVPLPNVSNNHQQKNAEVLEKINAAFIISDAEITQNNLNETISKIIQDSRKLEEMGKNARKINITNVEGKIYKEIKMQI